jgi:hypothetical protein
MRVLRPVLAVGALILLAGPALAQGSRYATIDVRAGYTVTPSADDADLAAGQGFKGQSSFGAGAAIALSDRLHLGFTFDWAHHSVKQLNGEIIGGPDDEQYNLFHTFVKLSFDAVNQEKFTVSLNAGPGLIFFSPNDILKAQAVESDRHFALNGGLTLTWWFADRIGVVLSPQADFALSRSSGHIFTDKSAVFFPLTGGFRFKI